MTVANLPDFDPVPRYSSVPPLKGHKSRIKEMLMCALITHLLLIFLLCVSCSGIDINDEHKILDEIQGNWTGIEKINGLYMHVRLDISDDSFQSWLMTTDSDKEPEWTVLPEEMGTFSLSSVLVDQDDPAKFRKLLFSVPGRCCGDKSVIVTTLSNHMIYDDKKGLRFGQGKLRKIQKI